MGGSCGLQRPLELARRQLALALRAYEQGHREITYLTFSKASARDGRNRILRAFAAEGLLGAVQVHASTIHSCAYGRLRDTQEGDMPQPRLWDDHRLRGWIGQECEQGIKEFLVPCDRELERRYNTGSIEKFLVPKNGELNRRYT